jgi:hypothetical protein
VSSRVSFKKEPLKSSSSISKSYAPIKPQYFDNIDDLGDYEEPQVIDLNNSFMSRSQMSIHKLAVSDP